MTYTSQACTDIARSRVQYAFAALEEIPGKIAYPETRHFIAITNDATISQSPEYDDSTEKLGTRDITERFKNAMPAAQATLAMYLAADDALGAKPQGYDVLLSLFGSSTLTNPPVFTLGAAGAGDTTIPLAETDPLSPLPPCGVIEVRDTGELIQYDSLSEDGMTLLGCKRGHKGTAADAVSQGAGADYRSLAFMQADCNPAFTYWLRTDHFLQAVTGATVNEASLSLSNAGAVNFEFSTVQGMESVMAGTGKVRTAAPAGATVIEVDLPKAYTPKALIWNSSLKDHNGEAGYKIVAVNDDAGTITLAAPISQAWPAETVVGGYLPLGARRTGEPIKGDTAEVYIDGVKGKLRSSSLSYSNNISYLNDEIGTRFPESFVEDSRSVELSMNTYFRKEDAVRFKEAYEGKFVTVRFVFGGGKVVLHMPKVQQSMPTPNMEPPTVSLDITGTALASGSGNNSVFLIFN